MSGISVQPQISARNLTLKLNTVTNTKADANPFIINYPALYLGLAQSVLIDNQDAVNPVTVRINRGVNSITINSSQNRAFNDAWIEQLDWGKLKHESTLPPPTPIIEKLEYEQNI